MKAETFKKIKLWYTVVVLVIIAALLVGAYVMYPKAGCFLFFCLAVLAALILLVTRVLISHNTPKDKPRFRNQKNK